MIADPKINRTLFYTVTAMLVALTTSCMSLAVKVMQLDKENAEVVTFTSNDRTIAFVPMKHVGPRAFYDDVRHIVDSLHEQGYSGYLESTRITDSLTQEEKDLVHLKLRKMLGAYISKNGYLDTINGRLMGHRFRNRQGLINQPPYRKMGADTEKDQIIDVPMNQIVAAYEAKFGDLQLNDCDYNLPVENKYECGKEPGRQVNSIIMSYREKHLATAIMNDKSKKIVVLYGALHKSGLLRELKAIDSTWTIAPSKKTKT